MKEAPIPFGRPYVTDEDRAAVLEVLKGDVLAHGPQGKSFESEFAAFLGGGHCLAVSSGMAALHLAYLEMGVGPGDEVIVPALTHTATAHAVEMVGARPVFADCLPASGNMDVSTIEPLVTPRTKAIGLVHFIGFPCDLGPILALAARRGLKVVEDCAIALGTRYDGTHVGLLGDAGAFSFYPVKHITTGEGGMFVTRHPEVARRVHHWRAFGVDRSFDERTVPGLYEITTLGLNYRMSDINASLGRVQLRHLPGLIDLRRRNDARLRERLRGAAGVRVLDGSGPRVEHSPYCLSVVLEGALAPRRNAVLLRMKERGVGTSVYYPHPLPRAAYYQKKYGTSAASVPAATEISDCSVALPVGPHLTEADVDRVAREFIETLNEVKS
ncbi:MAG TPA: DegT/DnrJ/EryC1/StrS family aminotransferase [Elusimicrobiota bacterium]|nr:DegT/DnrJ/EryC1/StrS family aminotransferase [Elusimicrobiota bacterium]